MRERLEQRLAELQNELAAGQKIQTELDAKRAQSHAKMLRIAGSLRSRRPDSRHEHGKP